MDYIIRIRERGLLSSMPESISHQFHDYLVDKKDCSNKQYGD